MSIFKRLLLLLFALLIPVLFMNSYSNQVSENVLKKKIQSSNFDQLTYFLSLIDTSVNRLKLNAIVLSNDPNVKEFASIPFYRDLFEDEKTRSLLQDKINTLAFSYDWTHHITIYSVITKQVISTDPLSVYDEAYLRKNVSPDWVYKDKDNYAKAGFYSYVTGPFTLETSFDNANFIVEISLSEDKIMNMLDEFKTSGRGDPFLYSVHGLIANQTANRPLIREVVQAIQKQPSGTPETFTLEIGGKEYLVNRIRSKTLGWYLIDYVSMQDILTPIQKGRNLFYIGMALLLLMGFMTTYLLYRHVQIPIRSLISGVKRLKMGDYAFRLKFLPKNEFGYLFVQFNQMTEQIQDLVEKVYAEKLRSREAILKQLQSQINPHFLYNCLGFIANMTKLGNDEAVLAMAYNLADYYRYTTRLEKKVTTLKEEILFITHYLEIQNLRMNLIRYEIDIPKELADLEVPLLILQPIVENAIIHGIQKKIGSCSIRVIGQIADDGITVSVEDDGPGLNAEEREQLKSKVSKQMDDEMGCGMWNVHKRLIYFFGGDAGLDFEPSPLGGLKVVLRLKTKGE